MQIGRPEQDSRTFWGLDPSTNTGLVITNAQGEVLESVNVSSEPRDAPTAAAKAAKQQGPLRHPVKRMGMLTEKLRGFVIKHGRPSLVAIEDFGFTPKQGMDSIITTCFVGYEYRAFLYSLGISYIEIPPTSLKKFCGANKKEEILREVYARWGFRAGTNDQADAYVLSRIVLAAAGLIPPTNADQRAVLKKLNDDEFIATHVPADAAPGIFQKE